MRTLSRVYVPVLLTLVLSLQAFGGLFSFGDRTTAGTRSFHEVPMSDGVMLATDVYLPEGDGPWPVILSRSTYSRNQDMDGFIENGYAAVVQDVRGMGASQGEKHIFYCDGWRSGKMDGADTVAWIKAQPWCNGKIGTTGTSALAMTQMLMAPSTRDVAAQYMDKVPANFYLDVTYPGGVFRKNLVEGWLTAIGQPDIVLYYKNLPLYNEYWSYYNVVSKAEDITAPAIFSGGWYDIFGQGTIDGFVSREERGGEGARGNNFLVMSCSTHGRDTTTDYGLGKNRNDVRASAIRKQFFDYHLKGDKDALTGVPKVQYYVMGDDTDPNSPGNEWRTADQWPPFPLERRAFYLGEEEVLATEAPKAEGFWREFVFNPNDPYPTWGGANLLPNLVSGPYDQRKYSQSRTDLLKYATEPLAAPLEILGNVQVRLFVSSDLPDTDFTAKLVDIFPEGDGREILILDNIRRVKSRLGFDQAAPPLQGRDDIVEIEINLWSTAWVFNKGHRIGLHISSSNYPRFEVNAGTGEDHPVPGGEMRTAHNRVHGGTTHPSALLLPIPQK